MTTELQRSEGKDQLKALLEKNRDFIMKAAPAHVKPERLMNMALTAYSTVPALRECWLPSVIGGIIQASIVGLELNTPLGQAYLIPFDNKKLGKKIAQLIIGYKGLIRLMQNSGALRSIHADVVRQGDLFEWEYGKEDKLRHRPAETRDGAITHFYCYVHLDNGGFQMEVMPKAKVDSIMAKSPTRGEYGPWKDHYEEMGIKTSIRRIAKYVPLSAEIQRAVALDEMADLGLQNLGDFTGATVEGEIHEPQPPDPALPPAATAPTAIDTGKRGRGRPRKAAEPAVAPEPVAAAAAPSPVQEPPAAPAQTPAPSLDEWLGQLEKATTKDDLDLLEDLTRALRPSAARVAAHELGKRRQEIE